MVVAVVDGRWTEVQLRGVRRGESVERRDVGEPGCGRVARFRVLPSWWSGARLHRAPVVAVPPSAVVVMVTTVVVALCVMASLRGAAAAQANVSRIVMGKSTTCAQLDADSVIKCWGSNSFGELGMGDTFARGDENWEMGLNLSSVELGLGRTASVLWGGGATGSFGCVALDDHGVKCWGQNTLGALGYGDSAHRGNEGGEMGDALPYVDLGTNTSGAVMQFTTGEYFVCARFAVGSVKCWGQNTAGQLGYEDTTHRGNLAGQMGDNLPYVDLGTGLSTDMLASTGYSVCARLNTSQSIKCWGSNSNGQLGYQDTNSRGHAGGTMGDNLDVVNLGHGINVSSLDGGFSHFCAILRPNNTVKCWGRGDNGQLGYETAAHRGDDTGEMGDALPAVDVLGSATMGRHVVQISCGLYTSCALIAPDGSLKCWGDNAHGQLGYGDTFDRGLAPSQMGDNLDAVDLGPGVAVQSVGAGFFTTCALLTDRSVKCFGFGNYLGQGDTENRGDEKWEMSNNLSRVDLGPQPTPSPSSAPSTTPTSMTSSAPTQLPTPHPTLPVRAPVTQVIALYESTCSIQAPPASDLRCWGRNDDGQLGQGDTTDRGDAKWEMGVNLSAVDLGTGLAPRPNITTPGMGYHICLVLDPSRSVKCFGLGGSGQLGYGDTASRGDDPGELGDALPFIDLGASLPPIVQIAHGNAHGCALFAQVFRIKCWGFNDNGQLGYEDGASRGDGAGEMGDSLPFVDLGTGLGAAELFMGHYHSCARLNDTNQGILKCWGLNGDGQLGYGDVNSRGIGVGEMGDALPLVNVSSSGHVHVTQGDGGGWHTCVLLNDSAVKCFGRGGEGRLGYGDTANRGANPGEMGDSLPVVDVLGSATGVRVVRVQCAESHSCALISDGSMKCWGWGAAGRLGQENTDTIGDGVGEMGDALPGIQLGARAILSASLGGSHTCVRLNDSSAKCFGLNTYGQLGQGDTTNQGDNPGEMGAALPVVDIGPVVTQAPTSVPTSFPTMSPTPAPTSMPTKAPSLAPSAQPTPTPSLNPTPAPTSMPTATPSSPMPSANPSPAPTQLPSPPPTPVPSFAPSLVPSAPTEVPALILSALNQHTCSLYGGKIKCWGDGASGKTGYETGTDIGSAPGQMGANLPFVGLGKGFDCVGVLSTNAISYHTCAANGSAGVGDQFVKCWATNNDGELGYGDTTSRGGSPGDMGDALPLVDLGSSPLVRTVDMLTVGFYHTCAVLGARTALKCWGEGASGQLGLGDTANRGDDPGEMGDALPFVDLGSNVTEILALSAAGRHTCIILATTNGSSELRVAKCWGSGGAGQLGQGDGANRGDGAGEMGNALPPIDLGAGREPVQIACGEHHTCVLLDDDSLKCFGLNGNGQLGYGDTSFRGNSVGQMGDALPVVDLGTGRHAVLISMGVRHSCALLDDHSVKCFGDNSFGQLGMGDTAHRGDDPGEMGDALEAVNLGSSAGNATYLETGRFHACVVFDCSNTSSNLKCFGYGVDGRLGYGNTQTLGDSPTDMGEALPFVNLGPVANTTNACYPETSTIVPSAAPSISAAPTPVPTFAPTVQPSLAPSSLPSANPSPAPTPSPSMAPTPAPSVTPPMPPSPAASPAPSLAPTPVPSPSPTAFHNNATDHSGARIVSLSAGHQHVCAVLHFPFVTRCWGYGVFGQLGTESVQDIGDDAGELGDNMTRVDLGRDQVASNVTCAEGTTGSHCCAVLANRTRAKCWGYNLFGQLGQGHNLPVGRSPGDMGDALPPVDLGHNGTILQLALGAGHSCALLSNRRIKCFGRNDFGQLGLEHFFQIGDGPGEMGFALPWVNLGTGRHVTAIDAGNQHSCALLDGGEVKCWGNNANGQLGQENTEFIGLSSGDMGDALPAITLGTNRSASYLKSGAHHVCVVLDNNDVKCWGSNSNGQLGYGDLEERGDDPGEMGNALAVVDLEGTSGEAVVGLGLGEDHSCALLSSGRVKCFGNNNNGQLGYGDIEGRGDGANEMGDSLALVSLAATVQSLTMAATASCALLADQSAKCWGRNNKGQLGQGHGNSLGDNPTEMASFLPRINVGSFQLPTQAPTAYPTASPTFAPSVAPTLSIETIMADNPVTGINISAVGTDYVGLSWSAIEDPRMVVMGYRVAMQTGGAGGYSTVSKPSTNWTTISSLQPSTFYRFKVAVVATRGVGSLSEEAASTWTWNNTAGFFENTGVFLRIVSSIPLPSCDAGAILDVSEDVSALFGTPNPLCTLINQRTARLQLVNGATLAPGTVVRVWTNETVAFSAPSNPTPIAATLTSASHVSWCDAWTTDASSSTGVGGSVYPLRYRWWVSSLDLGNAAAVTAANTHLSSLPWTTSQTLFNATHFVQDSVVSVQVTVSSSVFNLSATTKADTNISAVKQPTVSIVGSANRSVLSFQDLAIRTAVSTPECFSGSANSSVFSWVAIQGQMPTTATTSTRTLFIPALSLDATQTYIFRVRMTLDDFPLLPAMTADVQVSTLLAPPVVALAGGTQRTVGCEANTTLDASQSYDPNVCSILESCDVLSFTWSCAGCSPPSSSPSDDIASHTDSIIELIACDVANNTDNGTTLQLDVTVFSSVSGLFTSETVQLNVLPATSALVIPDLDVQPIPERMNPEHDLYVCTTSEVELALHEATLASLPALFSASGSYFIVPTDNMVVGVLYEVRMTDVATGLATVTIDVELNVPPSLGTMTIDPPTGGEAVLDSFRIASSGHIDDASDLPFSLTYSWTDDGDYESVISANIADFFLDEVALPTGSSVTCSIVVADRLGASAYLATTLAGDVVISQAPSWVPTVTVLTDLSRPGAAASALRSWKPEKPQYASFTNALLLNLLLFLESFPAITSSDLAQSEFSAVHLMADLVLHTDQEEYPITIPAFEDRLLAIASPAFLGIRADVLSQTTCDRALTITKATRLAEVESSLVFLSDVADSSCGEGVFTEVGQQQALYVNLSAGCNIFVNNYRTDVGDIVSLNELREEAASCIAGFALDVSQEGVDQITTSAQGGVVDFVDTRSATLGAAGDDDFSTDNASVLTDVHEIELRPSSLPCTQQCNSWEGMSNATCTPLDVPANTSDLPAGAVQVTVSMDTLDKCGEIRNDLTCLHLQVEDLEAAAGNSSSLVWDMEGCEVSDTTPTELTCSCNHLTAFAVGTLVGDGDDDVPCGKSQSQCEKLDSAWSDIYDHPGYAAWLSALCVAWIVVLVTDAQWFFDEDSKQRRSKFTLLVFIGYATIVIAVVRIVYYMLMLVAYSTADNMACAEFGLDGSGSVITPYALFAVHDVFYPMLLTLFACVFLYWITLADLLETNMGRAKNVLFLQAPTLHKVIGVNVVLLSYVVAVDTYLVCAGNDSGTDTLARAHLALVAGIFLVEAGMFIYARVQLDRAAKNKQMMAKVEFISKVICGLFAVMGLVLLAIAAAPVTDHAAAALALYSLLLPLLEIVTVHFLYSTLQQKRQSGDGSAGWAAEKLQHCWKQLCPTSGVAEFSDDSSGHNVAPPFAANRPTHQAHLGAAAPAAVATPGGGPSPADRRPQQKSSVFHTVRSSPDGAGAHGGDVEMQTTRVRSGPGPGPGPAPAPGPDRRPGSHGAAPRRGRARNGGTATDRPMVAWETQQPSSRRGNNRGPGAGPGPRPSVAGDGAGFTGYNPMARAPSGR